MSGISAIRRTRACRRVLQGFIVALGAFGIALTGHGLSERPRPGCAERVQERLFFGLTGPEGAIPDAEWDRFVETVVTPKFPAGLTVLQATGQWQTRDRRVGRESSRVLEIVHDASKDSSRRVAEIASEYKARFRQESVLVTRARIDACF